jgi:hypothetical protein
MSHIYPNTICRAYNVKYSQLYLQIVPQTGQQQHVAEANPYNKVSIIVAPLCNILGNIGSLLGGTRAFSKKYFARYIFVRVWAEQSFFELLTCKFSAMTMICLSQEGDI